MSPTYPVIKGGLLSSEHYTWNTADSVGRGASAVVFLGRHKVQGTVVAVKVFHDHIALGHRQDDLRELELLRRLDHPNIIRLLDIEKELSSQKTVLVTEYCEGGSLHQMLDQPIYYYGLPEHEFLLVLFHVSAGMQYLRQKNVIHRDIKPGNIMRFLTEEGFSIYKLTDFGAARNLDDDESFQSLYGTEEYLYPGVYERAVLRLPTAQTFDAKVDLWSLGVTFYHTATGELPFQPFGGRQNRETMFNIITQKEHGVISGVQSFQNGPIQWKKDLPETSPLSSGLKSIIVPLLAGLMEPDAGRMISYEKFFQTVDELEQKMTIDVFHFSRCENLKVYADPDIRLSALQDLIASLTDIPADDQILLVGGRPLEDVVDSMVALRNYPKHLLHDSLFLFSKQMSDTSRLPKPEIPAFPEFTAYSDMDSDARLAHSCATRGELIKRFQKRICDQEEKLMNGLLYLLMFVESRLLATKISHEYMQQLMTGCSLHVKTFFNMCNLVKSLILSIDKNHEDLKKVDSVLNDKVISHVYKKAEERMNEIDQYRETLLRRLDEVKTLARNVTAGCRQDKCLEKGTHHMSVISGIQSRFRRDKSVKLQMTKHDETIHQFERQKLQMHCVMMKSIYTGHCIGQLEKVFKSAVNVCESLTRCLTRVMKVEKNITSVLNCQKLLSEKLIKLGDSLNLKSVGESGFVDGEISDEGSQRLVGRSSQKDAEGGKPNSLLPGSFTEDVSFVSTQTQELSQKLEELQFDLFLNSQLLKSLDDTPLQSSGSMARHIEAANMAMAEHMGDLRMRLPSSNSLNPGSANVLQSDSYSGASPVEGSNSAVPYTQEATTALERYNTAVTYSQDLKIAGRRLVGGERLPASNVPYSQNTAVPFSQDLKIAARGLSGGERLPTSNGYQLSTYLDDRISYPPTQLEQSPSESESGYRDFASLNTLKAAQLPKNFNVNGMMALQDSPTGSKMVHEGTTIQNGDQNGAFIFHPGSKPGTPIQEVTSLEKTKQYGSDYSSSEDNT